MSNSSSNATSPSTSSRPPTFGTTMAKSGSNRSLFQTSRKPVSRSRQNTIGLDFAGEDLVRNIGSDYQDIQIRTLTKWVNAQLKKVDDSIDNIKTDLRDGKKLLKLLSVISNEPAPKPERMNMRIHQLANVAQALGFLEKQVGSESIPDIGNEAIVNGDAKKTIALIFFIMLKYQIHLIVSEHGDDFLQSLSELSERENGVKSKPSDFTNIEKTTVSPSPLPLAASRKVSSHNSIADKLQHTSTSAEAKVALLYWVRIQLEDYIAANIIPSIQDFSRSWRTGVAFCLLIHRHNPAYIPDLFSTHLAADLSQKSTWNQLLALAFDLATTKMGIQAYLEPEDLIDVDYPHEPSVMMYVSEYYKVMSAFQREEPSNLKRERAVKRKAVIVMATGGPSSQTQQNVDEGDDDDDEEDDDDGVEMFVDNESLPSPSTETQSSSLLQKLEPPVPVPMPSTRRRKKMAQRRSTLGTEDKARIKADLNSKLLMQLTGHLPRGVHPLLDQLLTIHETVLSFIKLNTRTIDEIPEEFVSSLSVSEYIDALEIIEEQADSEVEHLETAETAKTTLTLAPETADDTIIRLTELQRTQVDKLYDILQKEWTQFMDLLHTTKEDLLSVERALIDTEEGAEEYAARADTMDQKLDSLRESFSAIQGGAIHPLDADSTQVDIDVYSQQLASFCSEFSTFQNSEWKEFKKVTRQLSRSVMQTVSSKSNSVMQKYDTLVADTEKGCQLCENFKRGRAIAATVQQMEDELDKIQSMMGDNSQEKATTNVAIKLLESKVSGVRTTIYSIQEQYEDLLTSDTRFADLLSKVQTRYEKVNEWVDQVRVWFVEAERIRGWIEEHTRTIQKCNETVEVDPLSNEFCAVDWSADVTDPIYQQHEKLRREIEHFNQDDMTRLRSHVRVLTGATDRSLTPADASTIEITLTTLTILDRMMHLLRKRTQWVDTLRLRIQWDTLMEKAIQWCHVKEDAIQAFITDKARLSEPEDEELKAYQLKQLTEEVIQVLVSLENSIAEYDKGDFSAVLDAYQEMEELDGSLPAHLEERQEAFERLFEMVMKQCAFARKVVEQFLTVNEVTTQFKKLRAEGDKMKNAMSYNTSDSGNSSSSSTGSSSSNNFSEQVQTFKDNSSNWVTMLMKRVPYPELPEELNSNAQMKEANEKANQAIRQQMDDYATHLAETTEDLDELLLSHRESLSLQQRASLAYDDMLRITHWLEEKVRVIQKFDASILDAADPIALESQALDRLDTEQDRIADKLKLMETRDMNNTLSIVHALELELDEAGSISIDRSTLVNGIVALEDAHTELKEAIDLRVKEIHVLRKRLVWEQQYDDGHHAIQDLAYKLWDFNSRFAQYDTEGLKKRASDSEPLQDTINKRGVYAQLYSTLEELQTHLAIISSDKAFNELEEAYRSMPEAIPKHLLQKQEQVKQEYQNLCQLSDYISSVVDQHDMLSDFFKSIAELQKSSEATLESIQSSLRESNSSSIAYNPSTVTSSYSDEQNEETVQLQQQIILAKEKMDAAFERAESITYLEGGDWFETLQPQTMIGHQDYNTQVKALVDKKLEMLTRLAGSMDSILDSFRYADATRTKLTACQTEANSIQEWINGATQALNRNHIDVSAASSSLSMEMLATFKSEHERLLFELDTFESLRVAEFHSNLSKLMQEVEQRANTVEGIHDACKQLAESVSHNILILRQSITTQMDSLEIGEKRLQWEADMEDGQCRIDFMNHQLQEYVSRKNKCVAQQDTLTNDAIESLVKEQRNIVEQCASFKEENLQHLETQFEDIKTLYPKLPLTKSIPVHIQERRDTMIRSIKKLEEALMWREKELGYIQQRCNLEAGIKNAMNEMSQRKKLISALIEEKGRWSPNETQPDNTLEALEQQWQLEKDAFDTYRSTVLDNLKLHYHTLQETSNSLKPGFMSELHTKKIEVMSQVEAQVDVDLVFARDVVSQRRQVSEFICKAVALEKEAEDIRELMLSSNHMKTSVDVSKKLSEYSIKVEEVKAFASTGILIPKRASEDDISMPVKVKDKTMNSVVQDIITTKLTRLNELTTSLSTLLKSQEVFTQLQYILKTYNAQIYTCSTWITSRRDILEKSVNLLDDQSLSTDINHLRDAVSQADSIQTAMRAHDNNYTLLCRYREKYIQVFDDQVFLSAQEKEDKLVEYDGVIADFEDISHQWNDLLLETEQVSKALSLALLPAELKNRIVSLMASFQTLQTEMEAAKEDSNDHSNLTDSQVSEWQEKIGYLESKEYDRLHSEIAEYKHTMSADMIESLMSRLDAAGDTVLEIRALLTSLYDIMNASRLRNTHAENSELFHNSAAKVIQSIEQLQSGPFSLTTDKLTSEVRMEHFKALKAAHKQLKESVIESQGFYEDSCSYYTGMKVQGVHTPESQQLQQNVEHTWQKLQAQNSCLSAFVTRTSKWMEGCDRLDHIQTSLAKLKTSVDKFMSSQQPSAAANNKVQKYEKQLNELLMALEELENTVKNSTDLSEDKPNKEKFLNRNAEICDLGNKIRQVLDKRRMDKERLSLLEAFRGEVAKVTKTCEDQISYIRQQANTNPEYHLKKADAISSIINAYSAALSHIQDNYNECKLKFDGIISDQATKLIRVYSHPEVQVEEHKISVEKLLKDLKGALKTENDYITSLKLLSRLAKHDKEIVRLISDLKANTSRSYHGGKPFARTARTRDLPELREFMHRYEAIETSVQEFYQKCTDIEKNINKRSNTTRTLAVTKAVEKRRDDMNKRWTEIKSSADDTRDRLDLLHKRQTVAGKLTESLKYADDLKDRVEALQLSGKSVSVEEQELDEIQGEIDMTLSKNISEIDVLLKSISRSHCTETVPGNPIQPQMATSESSLRSQRDKLKMAIRELSRLVEHRRKQAHTEGSITEFFDIANQIDEQVLRLSKVVKDTSAQHANVVGSKFNKADLQTLFKTLVSAYKKAEPRISNLIDKAKSESQKQFLDDNERVAERLKQTIKTWTEVQASVSAREKELQTCIKELNHEFFTKLAVAKSTPRERRARRGSKTAKTPPQIPGTSRPGFRSSTLSTEMKMTASVNALNQGRKSKTPVHLGSSGKSTKYIPDPKNELDVQLGMIVNQSPFRMKVKMVPGEVGKYWFGDEHPRLVYCRILPSKMVMVRVGGGWEELSRFMKDHGHSDGLATKSETGETQYVTVNTFKDPVDDSPAYSVTTRSGSPMGPIVGTPIIRRGSGVSSSLTNRSSNSSSCGFVEGDKFIQTDEEGNQIALKMIKAQKQ